MYDNSKHSIQQSSDRMKWLLELNDMIRLAFSLVLQITQLKEIFEVKGLPLFPMVEFHLEMLDNLRQWQKLCYLLEYIESEELIRAGQKNAIHGPIHFREHQKLKIKMDDLRSSFHEMKKHLEELSALSLN